jgi:hypothetical protein
MTALIWPSDHSRAWARTILRCNPDIDTIAQIVLRFRTGAPHLAKAIIDELRDPIARQNVVAAIDMIEARGNG